MTLCATKMNSCLCGCGGSGEFRLQVLKYLTSSAALWAIEPVCRVFMDWWTAAFFLPNIFFPNSTALTPAAHTAPAPTSRHLLLLGDYLRDAEKQCWRERAGSAAGTTRSC